MAVWSCDNKKKRTMSYQEELRFISLSFSVFYLSTPRPTPVSPRLPLAFSSSSSLSLSSLSLFCIYLLFLTPSESLSFS